MAELLESNQAVINIIIHVDCVFMTMNTHSSMEVYAGSFISGLVSQL